MLGTSAAHPTVERACSGYLIREGETSILLDMGSGITRNLMRWMDPLSLNAIVVSHLHQDHFIDIYPLYYYLAFHDQKYLPIDVYAPEGARDFILQILPPGSASSFDATYSFKPLRHRGFFEVGNIRCQSIEVRHVLKSFGLRVSSNRSVVSYSSDTGFDENLYEIASESDVFICESTTRQEREGLLHLTPAQAGMIASKAGARKLVLTHIWPDFDRFEFQQMAAAQYDGPIVLAEDNMKIELEG